MEYELFEPRIITDPKTANREIVELFRDATARTMNGSYKNGVKVRRWKAQQVKRAGRKLQRTIAQTPADPSSRY